MKTLSPERPAIPDFVVIGAMRAGTTTLYELMRASGCVSVPRMKETDFFMTERHFARGEKWLRGQFDDFSKPLCDFSANYSRRGTFAHPAKYIFQTNPDVRLIYLVRDPVKRAKSQYRHMASSGFDMPSSEALPGHKEGDVILDASLYAYQLEVYLDHFSLEDIIIIDFEDLISDPAGTLAKLYDRLGIEHQDLSVAPVQANSSQTLEAMPAFWGRLRRSPVGEAIRQRIPRGLLNRTKRVVASITPNTPTPEWSEAAETFIKNGVKEDTARFRKMTGRGFETWSV